MPAFMLVGVILTSRSLPLRVPGIGELRSTSWIVWVHLYGSLLCSLSSWALAALSVASCSAGGGEVDMFGYTGRCGMMYIESMLCYGMVMFVCACGGIET